MANTRFLTTGIRAPDLGIPVPKTMQAAAMEYLKQIRETLKEIERKRRKRRHRQRRLPVWEDDEAGWWRRRRRSTTMLWIPEFPALPEIKQDEAEEEEEGENSEEEDEVEEMGLNHPLQNSDPVEVTVEEVEVSPELTMDQSMMTEQGSKHPSVTEEEIPKTQKGMFGTDIHFSGYADRGQVQLPPWQSSGGGEKRTTEELGSHLKGIAREASREVGGMSRLVFDGGGKSHHQGAAASLEVMALVLVTSVDATTSVVIGVGHRRGTTIPSRVVCISTTQTVMTTTSTSTKVGRRVSICVHHRSHLTQR